MLSTLFALFPNTGAVGGDGGDDGDDKEKAEEEERERQEAIREAEERRKEKHRKMEEEREKMRQDIRDKVSDAATPLLPSPSCQLHIIEAVLTSTSNRLPLPAEVQIDSSRESFL